MSAPLRPKFQDLEAAVVDTVARVEQMLVSGILPEDITIIGASQGAIIAMLTSETIKNQDVKFVLMGACNPWVRDELAPALHGRVLSVYEADDRYGGSCDELVSASPGVGQTHEVRLETGLGHGFLYRPLPEWVQPALSWASSVAPSEE